MDILVMAIVGFTAISLIVLAIGRWNENRRRRFLAIFGESAPTKRACPEELRILRGIAYRKIWTFLNEATASRVTREDSRHLETVRTLALAERASLRKADEAFKLAKRFGLVSELIKTVKEFTAAYSNEVSSDMK